MGVNNPNWRVVVAGTDVTGKMRPRLVSLRLTEKRGSEADQLDIALDDTDGLLALPKEGAEIALELGWLDGPDVQAGLVDKGRFKVDSVNHSGPPDTVTIRARAVDFTSKISTRRSKSWHDATLGTVVREVASANGLTPRIEAKLAAIPVKSLSQSRESDVAFLRRLGKEHDALATIKRGFLLFAPIGTGKTASGKDLPTAIIARRQQDRHSFDIEAREGAGKVTADWHDRKSAAKKTVTAGSGDGAERKLARTYASEAAAKKAVAAESSRSKRAPRKMSVTLALGRVDLYPEQKTSVAGFKAEIDATKWVIAEVQHQLDSSGGFTSRVQLELAQ
jgi:phage protein D